MTMPSLNETATENDVLRKEPVQQVKKGEDFIHKSAMEFPLNLLKSNFKKKLITNVRS